MLTNPHITVSAVIEEAGRFLLVEEEIDGQQVLNNPAGHVEDGESFEAAVIREVQEETARDFEPEGVTGLYLWRRPDAETTFLRVSFHGQARHYNPASPLDDDISRTLWMSRDDIAAETDRLRSPLVLRCIDDYIAGRHYPLDLLTRMPDGFRFD